MQVNGDTWAVDYKGHKALHSKGVEIFLGSSGEIRVFCQGEADCTGLPFGHVSAHRRDCYRGERVANLLLCPEHPESGESEPLKVAVLG